MAKTIKAIVCPQCGSNQKTEIKPDYYKCTSCNTEYILDNDDITILHKNSPTPILPQVKPVKIALIFGVLFTLFLFIFISNFFTSNSSKSNTFESFEKDVDFNDDQMMLIKNKKGELLFVTIGIERTGSYPNWNEKAVVFFDDSNAKNLKKQELNLSIPKNKASLPFKAKYFSNGEVYIIFNEKKLFKIEPDVLEVRELKEDFFKAPEFSSGFAKLEEDYRNDGFKILTLDGKSYSYFPIINTVIPANQLYDAEEKIPTGAINTLKFAFTSETSGDPNCLVKYTQKMKQGYPTDNFWFNFKEGKITIFGKSNLSYERFLTDRVFFNDDVLGYNEEMLIISFTIDTNRESPKQIQALDTKTGNILWTFDTSTLDLQYGISPTKALISKEITIIHSHTMGLTINNKTGKLVAQLAYR